MSAYRSSLFQFPRGAPDYLYQDRVYNPRECATPDTLSMGYADREITHYVVQCRRTGGHRIPLRVHENQTVELGWVADTVPGIP